MSDRLPIQPRATNFEETQRIADRGRADLIRIQAEAQASQARAEETRAFFQGIGRIGELLAQRHVNAINRDALARRTEAKSRMAMSSLQILRELSNDDTPGAEVLGKGLGQYRMLRDREAQGIRWKPQRALFIAETDQQLMTLGHRLLQVEDEKTMTAGRTVHYQAQSAYIEQGTPEAVRRLWEESVEGGLFGPDALRAGGEMESGVRAAAINQVTAAAQIIYEREGMSAALDWVLNPESHEDGWLLQHSDLRSIAATLRGQEDSQQLRLTVMRDEQRGAIMDYLRPMQLGQEAPPATLADLETNLDRLGPNLMAKELATIKLAAATELGFGLADASEAMQAERRMVITGLEAELREMESSQLPHGRAMIEAHYLTGTFGSGASARVVRDNLLSYVDEQQKELLAPGLAEIDATITKARMFNAAVKRGYPEPVFVGDTIYDKEDGDALKIGDLEGNAIEVTDAQGRPAQTSWDALRAEIIGDYRTVLNQMLTDKKPVDAMTALTVARQTMDRRFKELIPGLQEFEDAMAGEALYQDYMISPELGLEQRRFLFFNLKPRIVNPERVALDAALEHLGTGGMLREQITMPRPEPLGDAFTGSLAVNSLQMRGMIDPGGEAMETWNKLRDEGEFVAAARVAAHMLPRDAGELADERRRGTIADFRDVGGGGFVVKFHDAGLWHPVHPLQAPEQPAAAAAPPTRQVGAVNTEVAQLQTRVVELTREYLRAAGDAARQESIQAELNEVASQMMLLRQRKLDAIDVGYRQLEQDAALNLDVLHSLTDTR